MVSPLDLADRLCFKLAHNGWQLKEVGDFEAQILIRRTELSVTTKLAIGDETPPIANRFRAWRRWRFSPQIFMRRTKL